MRCSSLAGVLFFIMVSTHAQFDWGVSVGTYTYDLRPGQDVQSFTAEGNGAPWSVGVWYRERPAGRIGLGLDAQWSRRSFHTNYGTGGLGGGTKHEAEVDIHLFHVAILPELRLDRNGRVLLRFGPQFGVGVAGQMSRAMQAWSILAPSADSVVLETAAQKDFRAGTRLFLGLGYRFGLCDRWSVAVDPYVAYGFTPITQEAPTLYTTDAGLKLSFGRSQLGRTLWQRVRAGAPLRD